MSKMSSVITKAKQGQSQLFSDLPANKAGILPSTRYQGSKYKILKWIDYYTKDLKFDSVLMFPDC